MTKESINTFNLMINNILIYDAIKDNKLSLEDFKQVFVRTPCTFLIMI